jgi:TRAP-type C4-dicarboxylate transport system permease small subunit
MFSTQTKRHLDKWVAIFLITLMALMVANVTWQVVSRYVFQSPSSFTDELSRYMLIWVGMLGAAYVAGKNEHLAIDILLTKLKGKAQDRLMILIHLCVLIFALVVMVIGGSNLVYLTLVLEQKSATLQIPMGVIYSIIPISGFLVIYYQVASILFLKKTYNTAH